MRVPLCVCAWLIRCHTRRIRNTWETERVRGGARGGSRECDDSPSRRRCQCACCSHNSPKIFCVSMPCKATKQESTRKYPSIICKKRQIDKRKRKRARERERRRSERDSDAKWMKMLSIELFYNNSTYFLYTNNWNNYNLYSICMNIVCVSATLIYPLLPGYSCLFVSCQM